MSTNANIKIDEKRTKKVVEEKLFKYREYLVTLPQSMIPKITASYSLTPPSNSNEFISKTENAAIERVLYENERKTYMEMIHEAIDTLKADEKKIVYEAYLSEDTTPDVEIFTGMHLGKTKYYKIKMQALLRLAFALKIEVYRKAVS